MYCATVLLLFTLEGFQPFHTSLLYNIIHILQQYSFSEVYIPFHFTVTLLYCFVFLSFLALCLGLLTVSSGARLVILEGLYSADTILLHLERHSVAHTSPPPPKP